MSTRIDRQYCPSNVALSGYSILNGTSRNINQLHFIYYPINRVMAAALSLTFGRGGALIGNLIFGFLIDLNCVIPIVLFSTMLFSKYHAHTHTPFYPVIYTPVFFYSQLAVSYVCCCQIPAARHWIEHHRYRIVSTLNSNTFTGKIIRGKHGFPWMDDVFKTQQLLNLI